MNTSKQKNNAVAAPNLSNGKIPPHDINAEKVILGSLLIDTGVAGVVFNKIKNPDAFYGLQHQLIFKAVKNVNESDVGLDMITIIDELRKCGDIGSVGGESYIIELSSMISSTAHIEFHLDIVLQKYAMRRVAALGAMLYQRGFDESESAEDILETAMKIIDVELSETAQSFHLPWNEVLVKVVQSVEKLTNNDGPIGIPTGFSELDKTIGGWLGSELIILAARPGVGKTALAVKFLIEAAKAGDSVAIFQLEMQDVQFAKRIVANESGHIHANQLYKHGMNGDEQFKSFMDVVDGLMDLPINIIAKSGLNVFEMRMEARKLYRSKKGLKFIVVDYLQLMNGSLKGGGNREQEVSQISRQLKNLANELDVPVLALSQLSRQVESRGTKRPVLSDLRESGAIEQDADMVCFLYRPEIYGFDTWQDGENVGESCIGQAEISIAKHRNGSIDNIRIGFDSNKVRFHEFEPLQLDNGKF